LAAWPWAAASAEADSPSPHPTKQPSTGKPPSAPAVAVAATFRSLDASLTDDQLHAIAQSIDDNRAAGAQLNPRHLLNVTASYTTSNTISFDTGQVTNTTPGPPFFPPQQSVFAALVTPSASEGPHPCCFRQSRYHVKSLA